MWYRKFCDWIAQHSLTSATGADSEWGNSKGDGQPLSPVFPNKITLPLKLVLPHFSLWGLYLCGVQTAVSFENSVVYDKLFVCLCFNFCIWMNHKPNFLDFILFVYLHISHTSTSCALVQHCELIHILPPAFSRFCLCIQDVHTCLHWHTNAHRQYSLPAIMVHVGWIHSLQISEKGVGDRGI